jgi:hypothetical protein
MPEVNSSFEQLLHCDRGQWASFVSCIRVDDASARIEPALGGELKIRGQWSEIRKNPMPKLISDL